ncbi:MAG TPA: hypoxanthine phosphoribosyltransferase [Candidatus Baltobacteraceae bacterium]|jgi:hypoxanthine phosphoribosyltransferase
MIFTADEIAAAIDRMAHDVARDYADESLLLIAILKGAMFVVTDLARALSRIEPGPRCTLDFMAVSSYGNNTRSSGEVRLLKDTSESVEGRNILIVEDIVDNGLTLHYLQGLLKSRAPKSLRTAVLLDKPYRRTADVRLDYVGLVSPDAFVVGYGLDYQEKYRTLPFVANLILPPGEPVP